MLLPVPSRPTDRTPLITTERTNVRRTLARRRLKHVWNRTGRMARRHQYMTLASAIKAGYVLPVQQHLGGRLNLEKYREVAEYDRDQAALLRRYKKAANSLMRAVTYARWAGIEPHDLHMPTY